MGIALVAKASGRGWAFYGVHTEDRWQHIKEAFLWSAPFLVAMTAFKVYLIETMPALENFTLFISPDRLTLSTLVTFVIYCVLSPIQEFVTRGVLQSSLEAFSVGRAVTWRAILLSNGIFAFSHLHISLSFALVAFIPGLFWGWLFARQRSLIGVSFSHVLLGVWGLYVLDLGIALRAVG